MFLLPVSAKTRRTDERAARAACRGRVHTPDKAQRFFRRPPPVRSLPRRRVFPRSMMIQLYRADVHTACPRVYLTLIHARVNARFPLCRRG